MVLNKSKWDLKAKIQYLKKHKLTNPKPQQEKNTPKWSGKRLNDLLRNAWLDESEDGEWDSEDEGVLNHFYPHISEDNLSVENKKKLKRQIIKMVKQREAGEAGDVFESNFGEEDGIYLGQKLLKTEEQEHEARSEYYEGDKYSDDEFELEIPDLDMKLSEFVVSDFGKLRSRKVLKNKVLENLLEEYGLDSYSSTVRDTDYNGSVKNKFRNVDKLTAADLHGFRIGETPKEPKQQGPRVLNEEELEEHRARAEKLKHARFHDQIKKKFGLDLAKGAIVLEINNFNANDQRQMDSLNSKLTLTNEGQHSRFCNMEDDLDALLGLESEKIEENDGYDKTESLDFLLETLAKASLKPKTKTEKAELRKVVANPDSFLDNLLGD